MMYMTANIVRKRHGEPASPAPGLRQAPASYLRLSYDQFGIVAAFCDVSAILVASVLSGTCYHWLAFGRAGAVGDFFGIGAVFAALTAGPMKLRGLYAPDSILSVRSQAAKIISIWTSVVLFLLGISFSLKISEDLSRGSMLSFAVSAPLLIVGLRSALKRTMLTALKNGWLKRSKIILITQYSNYPDSQYSNYPDSKVSPAYEVVARYDLPQDLDFFSDVLARVVSAVRGSNASEVHFAVNWSRWPEMKHMLLHLRILPVPIRLFADPIAHDILQYRHQRTDGIVSFELQRPPLSTAERATKRAFDIVIAAIGLAATALPLLAIAIAVRLDSGGPVLFRQTRGGFNGRAFQILKFRTMHVLENGQTITQAGRRDARVSRLGRWLRRSSLDELPQLINVLCGDMSLIGPRPHALAHDVQYTNLIAKYPYRHHVKPGITGWAQVTGFRGETPTLDLMKQRVELDLWYVRNWSFWLDLRILGRTILEVYRARNAF